MDWVERMNQAISYIEDHITEEIDYEAAAKAACCSVYHFQRMFSFITDVSLSEYIRRRRLSLAAYELQNSNIKVIDLALKYGYDSPEAFTRAFQNLHGTTPTAARNLGTKLKAYSRLSFQISIKGVVGMNYRIEELGRFSIVGVQHRVNNNDSFNMISNLWNNAARDGGFEELWAIQQPNHKLRGLLGVCADGDHGNHEEFHYILSVTSELRLPPERMVRREFPESVWAVFEADGGPEGIVEIWKRLYTEWLPDSAYELADLPAVECYLPPEENRNELWIAVIKK